jgi:uncharacterized protein (DUF1800 family)
MSTPANEALLALQRFGMGPRPGSIAAIASDPRGALLAELDNPPPYPAAAAALPSSTKAVRMIADADARRRAKAIVATREEAKQPMAAASTMEAEAATGPKMSEAGQKAAMDAVPDPRRPIYRDEAKLRTEAALQADIGFTERLVWFWSNHFCISIDKIISMAGAYEREAIRPNILGHFSDLLLAAENHPAMLFYLDNLGSMGANSVAGINRSLGPNENLSREVLELHTLGVRSGYTQDDVIRFANTLTGWTWVPPNSSPDHGGEFAFNARMHEPGPQTVLGKRYDQEDVEQARAVLRDLAAQPATATHIATKLARHFVADTPPPELVDRMAKTFLESGGDLKATAKAMIAAPESWALPPSKLKRPSEWAVSTVRAVGMTEIDTKAYLDALRLLGEPLWRPPSPKGFPDDEASWIDGIGRRLDLANRFADQIADKADPNEIIETVLASSASSELMQAVGQCETRQQALSLLFMSTEFLRR